MSPFPIALSGVLATLALCASARADEPSFREVGRERGLPAELFSGRNRFCDLDGDGWPDVVLANRHVYRNVPAPGGGRRFVEVPGALGLGPKDPTPVLLCFADLDHDGDRDAFLGIKGDARDPKWKDPGVRSRILLNVGGLRFQSAGLDLGLAPESLVAGGFFDRDHDGWLDLVLGSSYRARGGPLEAYPLRLLAGGPRLAFREVTGPAGLGLRAAAGHPDSRRPLFGVSFADLDGDGRSEVLLCAYGRQRNLLYLNQGDGTFREVGRETRFAGDADQSGAYPQSTKDMFKRRFGQAREDEAPFRSNGNTFDAPCGDYDNDGDLDVFLGEITHAWAGPSSDRSGILTNRGEPLGFSRLDSTALPRTHAVPNWNQGDLYAGWLDVDNDGRLDLLVASGEYPDDQRLRLFWQTPQRTFVDRTQAAGLDWPSCTGMSFADYDRDGDVDVLVGKSNNRLSGPLRHKVLRPALFENVVGSKRSWLNVRLVGKGPQAEGAARDALGARVTVWVGETPFVREIVGSKGHAGHNDALEAAFGLGDATKIDRLEVRWPNRALSRSVFRDLKPNQRLLIREGAREPEVLTR